MSFVFDLFVLGDTKHTPDEGARGKQSISGHTRYFREMQLWYMITSCRLVPYVVLLL